MLNRTHLMAPLTAALVFCALASNVEASETLAADGAKAADTPNIQLAQRWERGGDGGRRDGGGGPRGGDGPRGGVERSAPDGGRSFDRTPGGGRSWRGESGGSERRGRQEGRSGERGPRSLWRGGENDRRVERSARERRIERDGDGRRANGRGDMRGRWDRGRDRWDRRRVRRHGRRFIWGPGIDFWFYDGYYYGDCAWLRRRAVVTGSRYWWRRYRLCRYTSW